MKRKSASKKLLPLMLILMLILGISMPANAAANPRLNKKGFVRGKNITVKGCKLEESREMVFFQ